MTANADDLKDITDFLAQTLPLSTMKPAALLDLARQLEIEYYPKRNRRPIPIEKHVYLVRKGAFEISNEHHKLIDRLGEGEFFGISTYLNEDNYKYQVYAIEDSLVYRLSQDTFHDLLNQQESIGKFFKKIAGYRASIGAIEPESQSLELQSTQTLDSLIEHELIRCRSNDSIQQAARLMRDHKVSCLVLEDNGQLVGIVTDRDIRNRVVANGLDIELPVSTIATSSVITIYSDATLLEAQLKMSQAGIHHLPVLQNKIPIGVITVTDITRSQSVSIVHLVDRINRAGSPTQVAQLQSNIIDLLSHWIQVNVSAKEIGDALAVIGDAFVRKAIFFAQKVQGSAPMQFAWLAFGSQARKEQSFTSDQDNGLILERLPNNAEAEYFTMFSEHVCQLLAQFGYPLCPGNIMASNPMWRKTKQQWIVSFQHWLETPEPVALLNASIFFDMRVIYGQKNWLDEIALAIAPSLKNADLFFMHMTKNALLRKPPLGFFRAFIVKDSGEHENELNIKHQGIALINDIARIAALSEQCFIAGTIERLNALDHKVLSKPVIASLIEAWLLLNDLKLESQVNLLKQNLPGSNYINPKELSPLRKAHLKNAFKAIKNAQKSVSMTYLNMGSF